MASRNDSTGDLMISKSYSEEGKNNFDNIFGARDWRNRPISPLEQLKELGKKTREAVSNHREDN